MAGQSLNNGDLIRVRAWSIDTDQAAVNTVYYLCTGPNTGGVTDNDVATSLEINWNPFYVSLLNNLAQWRGVQVQRVTLPPSAPAIGNANPTSGSAGAIALPRQTCGLIQFQSGSAGRQYRGRLYLPFPSSTDNATNGQPSGTYLTNLLAFATFLQNTFFLTDSTGVKFIPCVQVINHGPFGNPPQPPPIPSPLTGWSISARWATQRRRGAFGRQNTSPI